MSVQNESVEFEPTIIVLQDGDGNTLEAEVVEVFDVEENGKTYAALLSTNEPDGLLLLRLGIDPTTQEEILEGIEDNAEFELATAALEKIIDQAMVDEGNSVETEGPVN